MKRVLVIEDDKNIGELLEIHLKDSFYEPTIINHGTEGCQLAKQNNFDLIILDIMLPGMDGIQICRELRGEKILTPILMLTAKTEEIDKVIGLECGADDYLTKPFSLRELMARVKAIFRRIESLSEAKRQPNEKQLLTFEELTVDLDKRTVTAHNQRIELTPKEFDLLVLLATNPGKTYTRERILNKVWGYEFDGYDHTVNSHINRLRAKIETDVSNPKFILTAWGVGYRFSDFSE
ncbi:response regulator transcription factor [Fulvivirgaceae bacterium BMA10]|uniref:Response regulator transcription factor n=1 Tax=Splendidivirga corallicola TaxID=3051826 RepID=A0ABT8KPV7_9BACT|nr:response regulator transcription factor [Fulvivirgaceae bacterium BMA10]